MPFFLLVGLVSWKWFASTLVSGSDSLSKNAGIIQQVKSQQTQVAALQTGEVEIANAGHNPPYFVSTQNAGKTLKLTRTGMALGVLEDATWEQRTIHLAAGDLLVLYTDGVTSQDSRRAEQPGYSSGSSGLGEERLLETILNCTKCSAQEIQDALVAEVHSFVGDAPQFDDITLMVIKREQ